uniref:Uncharacterized protein n=1 Tax=Strombidium inclinatum TaxID=197538 RepID=A0A7S3J0L4_9SPIT|mmetsp:Transcript_8081/g.12436  ORF Transcript_8081/g.12436 Transcript_8081/m.12436 type:complete len:191 (+) Transcript_8081:3956-4528(+)
MCFKEFNKKKTFATQLRVQTMQAEEGLTRFKTAVAKQESILFDVTDSSEHESFVKYTNVKYEDEESKQGEKVKVVNSTLQAFSLSISSSKAFEVAIRKPRKKVKHLMAELYAQCYGVYLLLVKHHGSPAERRDILKTLLFFSMALALDLLVTIYIMLEIFKVEDDSNNYDTFGWVFMDFYFVYSRRSIFS